MKNPFEVFIKLKRGTVRHLTPEHPEFDPVGIINALREEESSLRLAILAIAVREAHWKFVMEEGQGDEEPLEFLEFVSQAVGKMILSDKGKEFADFWFKGEIVVAGTPHKIHAMLVTDMELGNIKNVITKCKKLLGHHNELLSEFGKLCTELKPMSDRFKAILCKNKGGICFAVGEVLTNRDLLYCLFPMVFVSINPIVMFVAGLLLAEMLRHGLDKLCRS